MSRSLFWDSMKNDFEHASMGPRRRVLWEWVVKCVQGEKGDLFCAHLVGAADSFDVVHLLVLISDFVHSDNIQVFGDRFQQFFSSTPKESEDIFTYITRMSCQIKEIERLNEIVGETGAQPIKIPDFVVVWKIFQAVQKYKDFDFFFRSFLVKRPRDWLNLNPEQLIGELKTYATNTRDLDGKSSQTIR